MGLRIEEEFLLRARIRAQFDMQGIIAAYRRLPKECGRELVLLQVKQAGIRDLSFGLHPNGVRAQHGGEVSRGVSVPRGLPVVGFDKTLAPDVQFGVVAVWKLGVEGIRASVAFARAGDAALDRKRSDLGKRVSPANSSHILFNNFHTLDSCCVLGLGRYDAE